MTAYLLSILKPDNNKTATQVRKPAWLLAFHLVETRGIEPLTS